MKRNIKKRKSNTALDLSLHKNYKVSKQNKFGDGGDKTDSQKSAEQNANIWLRNWYGDPTTQQMMNTLDTRDYSENPFVTPNGTSISDANTARKAIIATSLNTTPVKYTDEFADNKFGQTYQSAYDPNKYLIKVNSGISGSLLDSTLSHEKDHILQYNLPFLNETTQPVPHTLKPGVEYDEYLDNKGEIRSRVMEARKALNLSPSKRDYTPEEAAEMQKSLVDMGAKAGNAGDLNRVTPETMAGYLNYLAQNDTPSYDMEDVSYAKYGGSFNVNKYGGGGAMSAISSVASAIGGKGGGGGGIGGKVGGIAGAATGILEASMANAKVDTSAADNAIEATKNHQLDDSSLDALADSYNTTPWADTDVNFKDFRPGAGELAMNTINATVQGVTAGASVGGPWGAVIGGVVGLGSAVGGIFAGRAKAKREEVRLEREAKEANAQKEAQAEANRDNIMQKQANKNLRNIAADGGQLDVYKEGEEYDLSPAEIKRLKSEGYDIDLGYNINDEIDIDPSDIQTLRELGYEFDII